MRSGDQNAPTSTPVPPTNIVQKDEKAPTTPYPAPRTCSPFGLGAQTEYSTNAPSTSWSVDCGNDMTRGDASAIPSTVPAANGATIFQSTLARMTPARPAFEPNCTSPCVGSTTAGGSIVAMTEISATPPPIPTAAVIAEVKKLKTISATALGVDSSGGMRAKSIVKAGCA